MILLTFALPHESGKFVPRLKNKTWHERGALPKVTGHFEGRQVSVIHTGMGPHRATACTADFLALNRPKLLIAAGYAGGLDERLRTGQLLIGENFTEPSLLSLAGGHGDAFIGKLTTQPRVAETPAEKRQLATETGAVAVDMETAAIHEQCRRANIPMVSVRAISDPVETAMPVPSEIWFDEERQQPRIVPLLAFLGRRPRKIPHFARFVGGTNHARRELTEFLCGFIRKL